MHENKQYQSMLDFSKRTRLFIKLAISFELLKSIDLLILNSNSNSNSIEVLLVPVMSIVQLFDAQFQRHIIEIVKRISCDLFMYHIQEYKFTFQIVLFAVGFLFHLK